MLVDSLPELPNSIITRPLRNPAHPVLAEGNLILEEDVTHAQIQARGHIIVNGQAEHCSLESETGSVFLLFGSVHFTRIKAAGNIYVKHSMDSGLTAGGDIVIEKAARQSALRAGRKIISETDEGLLIGGRAEAGELVSVCSIGSPEETATSVVVGDPLGRIVYAELLPGAWLQIGDCQLRVTQRHGRGWAEVRNGTIQLSVASG